MPVRSIRLPTFLALAALWLLAFSAPAMAQTADAAMPAEQASALAEALKDEKTRAALIKELERIGGATDAAEPPPEPERKPISRVIAEATSAVVNDVAASTSSLWRQLQAAPEHFAGLRDGAADAILDAFLELALIIVATAGAFFVLRRIGRQFDTAFGVRAARSGFVQTVFLVAASILIDVLVVALSWAVGHVLALFAVGETGSLGVRQALYLNAFLVVELVKVAFRTVLSPNTGSLRPIPVPDRAARTLSVWLSVVVSVLGYGQLLVVPIVAEQVSWLAGQSVGVLVALIALALLVILVVSRRSRVTAWLLEDRNMGSGSRLAAFTARNWHVPVLLYLGALCLLVLTRPEGVLLPVLRSSAEILGALVVGSMAAKFVSRSIARGVSLPEGVNQRLPLLERRLNAFVPRALTLVRFLIVLAVLAFALQTIGAIDLEQWLVSRFGARLTEILVSVALVLLAAFAVWLAVSSYIDYRLNPDFGAMPSSREQTLLSLAKNAFTIVAIAVTSMFVLSEIGLDIAPLIASAGVIGLAIGFGSQKLVQDIITGVFIQFENAMNVGDIVQVGGTSGVVERLTIRSVSLRDLHGVFHIIPFSSVDMVSNYMRGFSQYVCDMGVAYREDIDEAKQAMFDAFAELRETEEWKPFILEDLNWMGLQAFGDSAIILRARIKTAPGKQFGIGRAYNAILKRVFDEREIEIPFPHQTIYFGEDKRGKAPAAHVALRREGGGGSPEAEAPEAEARPKAKPEEAPPPGRRSAAAGAAGGDPAP